MLKPKKFLPLSLSVILPLIFLALPCISLAADETLTITTYYPSPYGSYNELRTYSNTYLATAGGNVGIGTTNPGAKLEVAGQVKITGGTPAVGEVLTSNAGGLATWEPPEGVPSGGVMFFNLASCPSGWTALVAARGRYLVGVPSGGTLASTQGTALSNLENRAAGKHTHSYVHPIYTGRGTAQGYGYPRDISDETGTGTGLKDGTNAPYLQLLVCQKN